MWNFFLKEMPKCCLEKLKRKGAVTFIFRKLYKSRDDECCFLIIETVKHNLCEINATNTNRMADLTLTLKMTSSQAVETSVTTNNSPSQDHLNTDNEPTTNIDSPPLYYTSVSSMNAF